MRGHLTARVWGWLAFGAAVAAAVLARFASRQSVAVRVALDLAQESVPPNSGLASLWWSADGGRAFAVGTGGRVLHRVEGGDTVPGRWESVPDPQQRALHSVSGGDGPWRHGRWGTSHERVFAAGEHGTLVDCTEERCTPVPSGTDDALRAVAVGGGQALVVGDHGTILHLAPSPETTVAAPEALVVERQDAPAGTRDLHAVCMRCTSVHGVPQCQGVIVGEGGLILEGDGVGLCDDGTRTSGVAGTSCSWTWSALPSPTGEDLLGVQCTAGALAVTSAAGARFQRAGEAWSPETSAPNTRAEILAPVYVTATTLWTTHTRALRTLVAFDSDVYARVDGRWLPIPGSGPFLAAATLPSAEGSSALLLTSGGQIELAR